MIKSWDGVFNLYSLNIFNCCYFSKMTTTHSVTQKTLVCYQNFKVIIMNYS